jgi:hypothetical protein
MIHTTVGLYPSGYVKLNGVTSEHLQNHIEYNKFWRPGRALFIDGILIYDGCVTANTINKYSYTISLLKIHKDTAPYH